MSYQNLFFQNFLILLYFLITSLINGQSVPQISFKYKNDKLEYNIGKNWSSLSTISSLVYDYQLRNDYNNQLIKRKSWIILENGSYSSLNGFTNFYFKNNFYSFLNFSINNNVLNNKNHFSPINLNSSGVGYNNGWVLIQIGKGSESWGAGNDIEIGLGGNSERYDYFMLTSNYGQVRVNYIHGFMESIDKTNHRYINARGLEWTNKKSLVVGVSESIIYSGLDRPFDIGYINPISSHLETELNNRLNVFGDSSANAVWQIHLDWIIMKNSRLSFNYLFDEFVIDQNIEIDKEHGNAYSMQYMFAPLYLKDKYLNIFFSHIFVGTPTFRHYSGSNNFVINGKPLGWKYGSDGIENHFGFNYLIKNKCYLSMVYGLVLIGEESILFRAYDRYRDYSKGKFPSGSVFKLKFLELELFYNLSNKITLVQKMKLMNRSVINYNQGTKYFLSLVFEL